MYRLKKQINSLFLVCLLGMLFSFTQNILNSISDDKEKLTIELSEEQDDEENRESKENRENKEKSETEIDEFFSSDINLSINLYYTSLNSLNLSIGNYSNNIFDLSTPPPKLA